MTHTSVRETQRQIDAREFAEWQAFYRIEPWGDDWMQTAVIAASNVNLWSKRKIRPERFIPRATVRKSPEQMAAMLAQWAAANGIKPKES